MSRLFDAMLESNTSYDYDLPVFEGYTEEAAGGVLACAEAHEDMTSVYEAMHSIAMIELAMEQDVNGVNEASLEIAMEGAVKNVFTKIVEMLKKLWAKLKNFFKSILMRVDAMTKGNKEFAEKYIPKLESLEDAGKVRDFKMQMYPYTHADDKVAGSAFKTINDGVIKKVNDKLPAYRTSFTDEEYSKDMDLINVVSNNKEEYYQEMRGSLIGQGRISSEDFKEKATKYFRGEKTSEVKLSSSKLSDVLKNSDSKDTINEAFKSMDDMFKKSIDEFKKIEKNATDSTDTGMEKQNKIFVRKASLLAEMVKTGSSISTACFNIWKSVYFDRCRDYKKYIVKAISAAK